MEEAKAFAEATLDTLPVYAAINPTNQTAASRKEIESWQKVQDGLYVYPKTSVANDPLYRKAGFPF